LTVTGRAGTARAAPPLGSVTGPDPVAPEEIVSTHTDIIRTGSPALGGRDSPATIDLVSLDVGWAVADDETAAVTAAFA
jgi:hypothetical protein